jgi:hypothetical protein
MSKIKIWCKRNFGRFTVNECELLGLRWFKNVYGDNINIFNCRSIWLDEQSRIYKCDELCDIENF